MRAPIRPLSSRRRRPASQTAILEVRRDIDVHDSSGFADRTGGTARANAASVASSASPALTDTNFPAWAANKSPMARALAAPDGDPGEDERTRIDRLRIDTGERVLPVYEDARAAASIVISSAAFSMKGVSRLGFVDDFAPDTT